MLLSFSVKNFKSFKDEATLDLHAAIINDFEQINTFEDEKEGSILKRPYVFESNSSGKYNLLNGIRYMRNMFVMVSRIIIFYMICSRIFYIYISYVYDIKRMI